MTDRLAERLLRTKTIFSASFGVSLTYAVPPRSPPSVNSINLFLPFDTAPSVTGMSVGEPGAVSRLDSGFYSEGCLQTRDGELGLSLHEVRVR